MPFFVYVLYSTSADRFYIGQTDNMTARLVRHNSGYEKATSPYVPWNIVLTLEKNSRGEAMVLEKKLKNLSRIRLLAFIKKYSRAETT